ncbi:hypothetical protein [Carnobacterium pleistocenium]|nr:hypothetical protein [Carnobacterium pleistocenium]
MSRAAEQISESAYYERPGYWEQQARFIGGIEICDDKTGEPLFTIGL